MYCGLTCRDGAQAVLFYNKHNGHILREDGCHHIRRVHTVPAPLPGLLHNTNHVNALFMRIHKHSGHILREDGCRHNK